MQWLAKRYPDTRMKRMTAARQTVIDVSTSIVAEHRRAIARQGEDGQDSCSGKDKCQANGVVHAPSAGEHVRLHVRVR